MKASDNLYSDGPYSTVVEVIELIGTTFVTGWKSGVGEPEKQSDDLYQVAESRLVRWLIDGQVGAVTIDEDGAYKPIETWRFSKPYFKINLAKSSFSWGENEWADLLVSRRDLAAAIARIRPGTARKSVTYDWREIVSLMWIVALENPELRTQAKLIGRVQQIYGDRTDLQPGDKELRPIARTILHHLGNRVLSRGVSGQESSSDEDAASA